MRLMNDQLGRILDELVAHMRLSNMDAQDLWDCWARSEFGDFFRFIQFELRKPDCHPYLTQLVSEMVTDRISK